MLALSTRTKWISIILLIILVLGISLFIYVRTPSNPEPIVIVFASSSENAEDSLGGMIKVSESEQEIQSYIASFGDRPVIVYGPALGSLHTAFMNVARGYPKTSVQFFLYENSPDVEEYERTHVASLERYIEDSDYVSLEKIILPREERTVVYKLSF